MFSNGIIQSAEDTTENDTKYRRTYRGENVSFSSKDSIRGLSFLIVFTATVHCG